MIDKEKISKFSQICKSANLKVTPQREVIYEILASTDVHPSADMVYKKAREKMSNISFDTVNRTLNTFAEVGVAFIVEGTGDTRRFDAGLDAHQHFKCVKCKRIIDFRAPEFDNIARPEGLDEKYKILRSAVYFEGICDHCQSDKIQNN